MKKDKKIALKTMAIKTKLANQIRTDIYKKHLEENFRTKYNKEVILTDEEKLKLFNEWFQLAKIMHIELTNYKAKRKYKNKVEELRKTKA